MGTFRSTCAFACASLILGYAFNATAADEAAPVPVAVTPAPPPPPGAPVEDAEDKETWRPLALTANPLSFAVMRFSLNVEYMPAKHHGLIFVPSAWMLGADSSANGNKTESSFKYFGGELGYHFYSGNRGANGFFIGPSAIFMYLSTSTKTTTNGVTDEASASSSIYGFALDIGGQHVARNGFTIGGGMGFMWLKASTSTSGPEPSVKVHGTLPRFLFTIGYSF